MGVSICFLVYDFVEWPQEPHQEHYEILQRMEKLEGELTGNRNCVCVCVCVCVCAHVCACVCECSVSAAFCISES